MTNRTLDDLTPDERALAEKNLAELEEQVAYVQSKAGELLRGEDMKYLALAATTAPRHPMARRIRAVLRTLREVAGPRA